MHYKHAIRELAVSVEMTMMMMIVKVMMRRRVMLMIEMMMMEKSDGDKEYDAKL